MADESVRPDPNPSTTWIGKQVDKARGYLQDRFYQGKAAVTPPDAPATTAGKARKKYGPGFGFGADIGENP
jgi:energy-converting hydrogenase Eha subunit B